MAEVHINQQLVQKYNLPIPRYTSYPTVPVWNEGIDVSQWQQAFEQQFTIHNQQQGISLYLHLPFCEKLCTYCGCNKKITTNHSVEEEYMQYILKEWHLYKKLFTQQPIIKELHIGGGTPTFFSPQNLTTLIKAILENCIVPDEHEFSLEGHPNNTTQEHLKALIALGFNRISFGVQDNDPEVQRVINRIQPLSAVKQVTEQARALGFKSVNYDLIYGLPKQTLTSIQKTIEECIALKPDRIAFYSYAHVPWTSRGQRLFDENDLPSTELKMQLYQLGKKIFTQQGYVDIGMDHFALPTDDLYIAFKQGWLHRNFMGYTTQRTAIMIGLGVSSISDIGVAFAQNEKTIHNYYERLNNNELPIFKGYFLTDEDRNFRQYILNISCLGKTNFKIEDIETLRTHCFPLLPALAKDGLIEWNEEAIQLTTLGRNFVRNVCAAFDLHLIKQQNTQGEKNLFSKAI